MQIMKWFVKGLKKHILFSNVSVVPKYVRVAFSSSSYYIIFYFWVTTLNKTKKKTCLLTNMLLLNFDGTETSDNLTIFI